MNKKFLMIAVLILSSITGYVYYRKHHVVTIPAEEPAKLNNTWDDETFPIKEEAEKEVAAPKEPEKKEVAPVPPKKEESTPEKQPKRKKKKNKNEHARRSEEAVRASV